MRYLLLLASLFLVINTSFGVIDVVSLTSWLDFKSKSKGGVSIIACINSSSLSSSLVARRRLDAAAAAADTSSSITFAIIDDKVLCESFLSSSPIRKSTFFVFTPETLSSSSSTSQLLRVPNSITASPIALIDFAIRASRPFVRVISTGDDIQTLIASSSSSSDSGIGFLLISDQKKNSDNGNNNNSESEFSRSFFHVAQLFHGRASFFSVHDENLIKNIIGGNDNDGDNEVAACNKNCIILIETTTNTKKKLVMLTPSASRHLPYAPSVCARAVGASFVEEPSLLLSGESAAGICGIYAWVIRHQWPRITELTPSTLELSHVDGRFLAFLSLGMIDTAAQALAQSLGSLADATTSLLPQNVRESFIFAVVERHSGGEIFTDQFAQILSNELIVVDTINAQFWRDQTIREEEDMDTWLREIVKGIAPSTHMGHTTMTTTAATLLLLLNSVLKKFLVKNDFVLFFICITAVIIIIITFIFYYYYTFAIQNNTPSTPVAITTTTNTSGSLLQGTIATSSGLLPQSLNISLPQETPQTDDNLLNKSRSPPASSRSPTIRGNGSGGGGEGGVPLSSTTSRSSSRRQQHQVSPRVSPT